MVQSNEGEEAKESKVRVSVAQRNLVLQEVMDELDRREKEMHRDLYASRDYSDGVRFENGRLQTWLNQKMEK